MDVTVSILGSRNLAQSEMILRNLFVSLQIGKTTHSSGQDGVHLERATFRSGSVEIPLVLTIASSTTNTKMYVRNIPMSSVLEQGGLHDTWIGVYPPGDPQNLHFDANAVPFDGSPQVLISISVEEDLMASNENLAAAYGNADVAGAAFPRGGTAFAPSNLSNVAGGSSIMGSGGYAPAPRLSSEEHEGRLTPRTAESQPESMYALTSGRKSMAYSPRPSPSIISRSGSMSAPLPWMPQMTLRQGPSSDFPPPASRALEAGANSFMDNTVREQEQRAQHIKEHIARMASAQREAQDVSRSLQEKLDLLAELRRQYKRVEAQLIQERDALQELDDRKGKLLAEEAEFKEQITQRDKAFQELRTNRDEIDRELSKALGEQGRQKTSMEATTNSFKMQAEVLANDIEQSRRQVVQLRSSLASRQDMIEKKRHAVKMDETVCVEKELERTKLSVKLDETRASLIEVKAGVEEQQRRYVQAEQGRKQASKKLATVQEELSLLTDESGDSPIRSSTKDAKAVLQQKKATLEERTVQVQRLEEELNDNRQQLEKQSTRMTELHAEASECELATQRFADKKAELEKKLEEKTSIVKAALGEQDEEQQRMAAAQQELFRQLAELEAYEKAAAEDRLQQAKVTEDLEKEVVARQNELAAVKQQVEELQKSCAELEATRSARKLLLEDRSTALQAAQARANSLEGEIAEAKLDVDGGAAKLADFEQDAEARGKELQDVRGKLSAMQEEISRLQDGSDHKASSERIIELDATALVIRVEVDKIAGEKEEALKEEARLQEELKQSEQALSMAKEDAVAVAAEQAQARKEVDQLSAEKDLLSQNFDSAKAKLDQLCQTQKANADALASTQYLVTSRVTELEELQEASKKQAQSFQDEAASLEAASEESERIGTELSAQVAELERRRTDAAQALEKRTSERELLQKEVDEANAEKELVVQEGEALLQQVLSQVEEVKARLEDEKQKKDAAEDKPQDNEQLLQLEKEADAEAEKVKKLEAELASRQAAVASRTAELEKLQVEEKSLHEATRALEQNRTQRSSSIGQTGLQQLEAEREMLAQKAKSLEAETKQLEQQMRDGDIIVLKKQLETKEMQLSASSVQRQEECAALRKELEQLRESTTADLQQVSSFPTSPAVRSPFQLSGAVAEREDSLKKISDELERAQSLVRQQRTAEEELRSDIRKIKEKISADRDRRKLQEDGSEKLLETIKGLHQQKSKKEEEVELLTLGLHELEQNNLTLEEENKKLQKQVEQMYGGTLESWAVEVYETKVAAEIARHQDEIELWKKKGEHNRVEKTQQLSKIQQQHEANVRHLQERIGALQKEVGHCTESVRTWEQERSKRKEASTAPATALPGLVVSQRPLSGNSQRRKALLVGMNYSNTHAQLKGCVNDVWNMQCLLRYTLQYSADQIRILVDTADGRSRPDRVPTKANILAGLNWLVAGAEPGDNLLFFFSGYGAQHPRSPGSDRYEAYLVPSDFSEDLPANFFEVAADLEKKNSSSSSAPSTEEQAAAALAARGTSTGGYRLVSLLEVHDFIFQLPKKCNMTLLLDCCYSVCPGVGPTCNCPAIFKKVNRGKVEYSKLRDFISRPRFLELPPLPVQHTPRNLPRSTAFLQCSLHSFSGCRLKEWCAEFPIEGTVQGAFSWAFLKALAQGHFHVGVYQFQQLLKDLMSKLKVQFQGVEQVPVLQLSEGAGMQDVVLWT